MIVRMVYEDGCMVNFEKITRKVKENINLRQNDGDSRQLVPNKSYTISEISELVQAFTPVIVSAVKAALDNAQPKIGS